MSTWNIPFANSQTIKSLLSDGVLLSISGSVLSVVILAGCLPNQTIVSNSSKAYGSLDDARRYNVQAMALVDSGKYVRAEQLYMLSLRISKGRLGNESLAVSRAHRDLGHLHSKKGDYSKPFNLDKPLAVKIIF